jgi:hypothetical protein
MAEATANFNTEILSSNSNNVSQYNLDVVIAKNFEPVGKYFYTFNNGESVPPGTVIFGNILSIPPFSSFDLAIVVFNGDKINPIEAIATTKVNIENTATAEFNTEILSSRQNGKELSYNLNDVIDKNFEGPYLYETSGLLPAGVRIEGGKGNILIIPSNVEFELVIVVSDGGEMNVANATTGVVLEPDPFIEEKNKFLENGNVQQKLNATKNEWTNIINRNPKKSEV